MTVRTEEPEARIIGAAFKLISREGAAAITTRKIAREAGVHLSAVHHKFGSKSTLLFAALEEATERTIGALPRHTRTDPGKHLEVADVTAALAGFVDREPSLPLVRCELLLYFRNDPAYGNCARDQQQRYLDALAGLWANVRTGGAGLLDCHALARLAASVVDGLALQRVSAGTPSSASEILATALQSDALSMACGEPMHVIREDSQARKAAPSPFLVQHSGHRAQRPALRKGGIS